MIPEGVNNHEPETKEFRVALILNGREILLGRWNAYDQSDAIARCKRDIDHSGDFNLFATEVEL